MYQKYKEVYVSYRRRTADVMKLRQEKDRDLKRFGGIRELVIQRDGEKCVTCGMTRQEHKDKWSRDITVDHKDGKGRTSILKNNELSNLQTLCLSCHSRKDATASWKKRKLLDK